MTDGALALAPAPAPAPALVPAPRLDPTTASSTPGSRRSTRSSGPGGLPRSASVAIRGDGSSGRTTLVLRLAAEAQARVRSSPGSTCRGASTRSRRSPAASGSSGSSSSPPRRSTRGWPSAARCWPDVRSDLLVLDLPGGRLAASDEPARIADRLGRLAALARRSETLLVVLEPPGLAGGLATAVAESTGLRLELARRSWIRLGRDIVGQRTEALVARNRYGPPGRRATLRILYADGGERDTCLRRDDLLHRSSPRAVPTIDERTHRDATPPSPPAAPPPRARPGASLRALPARPAHPGRPAVGSGPGHRREPGRPGAGRPARDAARERPSARP